MEGHDPARRGDSAPPLSRPPQQPRERHSLAPRRGALVQLTLALALTLSASPARCDDIDDLLAARDDHANGDYARASRAFRRLLEATPTSPQLGPISTTIRKLYGATLYAQRSEPRALAECRAQIAALLREDPYARLDTTQFEEGYRRLFEEVASELRDELDRLTNERVAARRRLEEERAARRALGMRMLTTETVVERSLPRPLTLLPFGVGQFVNGNSGAGWGLLATEVALAVTCVTASSLYATLLSERDANVIAGSSRGNAIEGAYYTAIITGGVLAITAVAGAWQAMAAWRPERQVTRRRVLPPELEGLQISLSPWAGERAGGLVLRGRF